MKFLSRILFIIAILFVFITGAECAARFAFCATTCTWDASNTAMWGTASNGVGVPASVPGSGDTVTFDANTCVGGTTCTTTLGAGYNPTIQSFTGGACTGTTTGCVIDLSVNNNNITFTSTSGFNFSGTGTRVLNMGNGNWTLSATSGTLWNTGTTTNLTLNQNGSNLIFSGANSALITVSGGGKTFNTVTFGASNRGGYSLTGANTITTLAITGPTTIVYPASTVTTITNAYTLAGSSSSPIAFVSASTAGSTVTIASGTASVDWFASRGITYNGGATFANTNSMDLGLNSGATFSVPTGGVSTANQLRPGIGQ